MQVYLYIHYRNKAPSYRLLIADLPSKLSTYIGEFNDYLSYASMHVLPTSRFQIEKKHYFLNVCIFHVLFSSVTFMLL